VIVSLVYSSHSNIDPVDAHFREEMEKIRTAASDFNVQHSITGFLIYFDQRFVQLLEGDFDDVALSYSRIRRDPRHRDARVIHFAEVESRAFQDWSMDSSMNYVAQHHELLSIKLKFLDRFINDTRQYPITVRDLMVAVAQEIARLRDFPRPRMVA
jgi:Sensors of blue-light using FAD